MEAFLSALSGLAIGRGSINSQRQVLWQKLEIGMIKANWDAAIDLHSQRMGLGALLRDANGGV